MAEVYAGEVRNGVVVLEGESPPEGAKVRVEVIETVAVSGETPPDADRYASLRRLIGLVPDGPSDASVRHDHRPSDEP
jgi:hypothetical protein